MTDRTISRRTFLRTAGATTLGAKQRHTGARVRSDFGQML